MLALCVTCELGSFPREENFDLHFREHVAYLLHRDAVQRLLQWFMGLERIII